MWLSACSHISTSAETGAKHELKGAHFQHSGAIIKVYVCFGYEDTIVILLMRGLTFLLPSPSVHKQLSALVSNIDQRIDTLP